MKRECKLVKIKLLGIAWKSRIILKRATAYISINKLIVTGCDLKKGEEIYSYLAEEESGRKVILVYPDGHKTNKFKAKSIG